MFRVIWDKETAKDFKGIAYKEAERIIRKVESALSSDPLKAGKPLKGHFQGLYRYRIGDYRMIYEIQYQEMLVIKVK